jgi:hypothetical protein
MATRIPRAAMPYRLSNRGKIAMFQINFETYAYLHKMKKLTSIMVEQHLKTLAWFTILASLSIYPVVAQQTKTEPTRCVEIGNIPYDQRWLYLDGEKYCLKEGCNGNWQEGNFVASCGGSDAMFLKTYCHAVVINSAGDPSCRGRRLKIYNASSKYPAYFGVNSTSSLNDKLGPGEARLTLLNQTLFSNV